MATIVFVHAHPDDEASSTGGSMARAAAEGHRVVLVVCTNGELRRVARRPRRRRDARRPAPAETEASAAVLGVARVAWLGYRDSGMTGWEQNDDPGSFWQADLDEAAERLAAILREEQADVVVLYDWHGGYGHPDHIQVHRVGHRAADLAGTPKRFEVDASTATCSPAGWPRSPERPTTTSTRTARPTTATRSARPRPSCTSPSTSPPTSPLKRQALAAHASQVTDIGMFLAMPDEHFACGPGRSGSSSRGAAPGLRDGWLLDADGARPPRPPRSGRRRVGHRPRSRARRRRARRRPTRSPTRLGPRRRRCRSSPARSGAARRRPPRSPGAGGSTPVVEPLVGEIPSPPGVRWASASPGCARR